MCDWIRYVIAVLALLANTIYPALCTDAKAAQADDLVTRAAAASARGAPDEAIRLATEAIQQDVANSAAYKLRGRELFRVGRIPESVVDLDRFATLRPDLEPRQWERGIAYFYAGKLQQGAEQFERYQTFDGHDVENSVWRYLCSVSVDGAERAQKRMLAIDNDRRIPMMKIWELYRGRCQPDDVLAAARAGNPDGDVLAGRLFYAHLYLGLWFDSRNDRDRARQYIDLAADQALEKNPHLNSYMWDVARIHQKKLRGELKTDGR